MTTFWGVVIALGVTWGVPCLIVLTLGLCRARRKPAPKPPRPQPTWADIHRRTQGTSADEYLVIRTPRAVHCIYLPRETDRFIESIYEQADQEKS